MAGRDKASASQNGHPAVPQNGNKQNNLNLELSLGVRYAPQAATQAQPLGIAAGQGNQQVPVAVPPPLAGGQSQNGAVRRLPSVDLMAQNQRTQGPRVYGNGIANGMPPETIRILGDLLPCVATIGSNGRRIYGFLFLNRLLIVCVCHCIYLTPAGFVEHSGATNIRDPWTTISVISRGRY